MEINQKDFIRIKNYICKKLTDTYNKSGSLDSTLIIGTIDEIHISDMLKQLNEKKEKKKVVIDPLLNEAWNRFWSLWPATKSVPGTEYKSGAKMKSDEIKRYSKWVAAIESGKVSIEVMYRAADTYLQWAYEDSKRLGRNELQYRNGLEPWLNQEMYITFSQVTPPVKTTEKKQSIYNNSTDQ